MLRIAIRLFVFICILFNLFLGLLALQDMQDETKFLAALALISFFGSLLCLIRIARVSDPISLRNLRIILAVLICSPLISYGLWSNIGRLSEPITKPAFVGDSQALKQTVVVPTLEAPLPQDKNVIWCASLQLAWDRLKEDAVGEPVKIKGAEELVDKLNSGEFPANVIEKESYYAAAGWKKDGVVAKIQGEMKAKFPDVVPDLSGSADTAVIAYAYLKAGLKFSIPYFENREPFEFKDSSGKSTHVSSFGIREEDAYAYYKMREQIKVLHLLREGNSRKLLEFALDLDRNSKPYQVVIARLEPKINLRQTLEYLDEKVKAGVKDAYSGEFNDFGSKFGINEVFLVPNINLDITRRFGELEGPDKPLLNPKCAGLWLGLVQQRIQFKLDRSGAEVASALKLLMRPMPRYFIFDKPFLVYLKKRDSNIPFFVMWVNNAELLCKP